MSLRAILFIVGFFFCVGGAFYAPVLGVIGYMLEYCVGAHGRWWHGPLRFLGIRYALTLAVVTGFGLLLHSRQLRWGEKLLMRQEELMMLFFGIVWLSVAVSEPTQTYSLVDHPSVKITKVFIFVFMLTHIVTTIRRLDWVLWTLVACALILGVQAYATPLSAYARGRLETVGGSDFRDANTLAAFVAALIPVIGVQFLRSRWLGKLFCLASATFAINTVILTRSRGAVVGLAMGSLAAVILAPRKYRGTMFLGICLGGLAVIYLADASFLKRSSTIVRDSASAESRDSSASSRLEVWAGAIRMAMDNPQGVGAGNFMQKIGQYAPEYPGRDAHNTYLRCVAELGVHGLVLLMVMIANAFFMLFRARTRSQRLDAEGDQRYRFLDQGLLVSLTVILSTGSFGSFLYVESFWWLLSLPVCLCRALDNDEWDIIPEEEQSEESTVTDEPGIARMIRGSP